MTTAAQVLDAYIVYYESLSPDRIGRLRDLAAENLHFRDPFNDIHGRHLVEEMLHDMFAKLKLVKFTMLEKYLNETSAALLWRFTAQMPRGRNTKMEFEGMSRIAFGTDGKIISHLDYWDAASGVYENIPLLGACLRLLKRRMSADAAGSIRK